MVAILSSPKGPEFQVYKLLNPNKSDPVTYCSITSKLTKVVQINEDKNNFFKFNIWLKKRVSKTFEYHIDLEIKNELTPSVWLNKEI